jgi:hypothetical protein
MNKEVKKKWISALLSGKYKQGRNSLRDREEKFCALGVLCDVIDPKGWQQCGPYYKFKGSVTNLPEAEKKKIKLQHHETHLIMEINDMQKASFKEVAKFIEEKL